MTVRQARNLMREPIWIVLLLVQPMVWLVLYGQLFHNVTRLGGFGTGSYITFLAPAIVVMNAFFGATWSGMSMINDLDHKVIERFLATPGVAVLARALADRALGDHRGDPGGRDPARLAARSACASTRASLGWLVIILAAILVNSSFAGISQAIALLTRREATMIAVANFIGLPLLFLSTTMIARPQMPGWMQTAALLQPGGLGRARCARGRAPRHVVERRSGWHLLLLLRAVGPDRRLGDPHLPRLPALALAG